MSIREDRARALATARGERWVDIGSLKRDVYRREAEKAIDRGEQPASVDETDAKAYIGIAMRDRMDELTDLLSLTDLQFTEEVAERLGSTRIGELGIDEETPEPNMVEEAERALRQTILCVDKAMVFEIVLGTGGPDSRILIECDMSTADYEGDPMATSTVYEIRRVLYRYSWSGSGEIELSGGDRLAAEMLARRVVPELVE